MVGGKASRYEVASWSRPLAGRVGFESLIRKTWFCIRLFKLVLETPSVTVACLSRNCQIKKQVKG